MKTKYINDVPSDIKAITYLGEIMPERINQLETRIKNYKSEIYRLNDKKTFTGLNVQEESLLDFYKNDLPKVEQELKILKEVAPKESSNYMFLLIPVIILLLIAKRKK